MSLNLQSDKPTSLHHLLGNLINVCPRWPMYGRELIGTPLPSRRRKRNDNNCVQELTLADITVARGREHLPHYLLFECAYGYALFDAPELTHVGMSTIKSVEDYINRSDQPFKLKASFLFSSDNEALDQMKAISKSTVTEQLQKFLLDCLPQPSTGGSRYCIATCDAALGSEISRKTGLASRSAILINDVTRSLREKIDKFLGLEPGVLEKAQRNLSHLYYNIKSPVVVSSSSSHSLKQQVGVVPHRFEGVFNVKGKEDMFCTKNLVPGEALYVNEDRTEVEYRVWDPLESKLGAAILFGVANIWILVKPGSRVLYIGNVCGLTISNLSDLVGSDGFVYVVAFSADVCRHGREEAKCCDNF
ncbi:Small subunit processome complex component [Orobanche minor]